MRAPCLLDRSEPASICYGTPPIYCSPSRRTRVSLARKLRPTCTELTRAACGAPSAPFFISRYSASGGGSVCLGGVERVVVLYVRGGTPPDPPATIGTSDARGRPAGADAHAPPGGAGTRIVHAGGQKRAAAIHRGVLSSPTRPQQIRPGQTAQRRTKSATQRPADKAGSGAVPALLVRLRRGRMGCTESSPGAAARTGRPSTANTTTTTTTTGRQSTHIRSLSQSGAPLPVYPGDALAARTRSPRALIHEGPKKSTSQLASGAAPPPPPLPFRLGSHLQQPPVAARGSAGGAAATTSSLPSTRGGFSSRDGASGRRDKDTPRGNKAVAAAPAAVKGKTNAPGSAALAGDGDGDEADGVGEAAAAAAAAAPIEGTLPPTADANPLRKRASTLTNPTPPQGATPVAAAAATTSPLTASLGASGYSAAARGEREPRGVGQRRIASAVARQSVSRTTGAGGSTPSSRPTSPEDGVDSGSGGGGGSGGGFDLAGSTRSADTAVPASPLDDAAGGAVEEQGGLPTTTTLPVTTTATPAIVTATPATTTGADDPERSPRPAPVGTAGIGGGKKDAPPPPPPRDSSRARNTTPQGRSAAGRRPPSLQPRASAARSSAPTLMAAACSSPSAAAAEGTRRASATAAGTPGFAAKHPPRMGRRTSPHGGAASSAHRSKTTPSTPLRPGAAATTNGTNSSAVVAGGVSGYAQDDSGVGAGAAGSHGNGVGDPLAPAGDVGDSDDEDAEADKIPPDVHWSEVRRQLRLMRRTLQKVLRARHSAVPSAAAAAPPRDASTGPPSIPSVTPGSTFGTWGGAGGAATGGRFSSKPSTPTAMSTTTVSAAMSVSSCAASLSPTSQSGRSMLSRTASLTLATQAQGNGTVAGNTAAPADTAGPGLVRALIGALNDVASGFVGGGGNGAGGLGAGAPDDACGLSSTVEESQGSEGQAAAAAAGDPAEECTAVDDPTANAALGDGEGGDVAGDVAPAEASGTAVGTGGAPRASREGRSVVAFEIETTGSNAPPPRESVGTAANGGTAATSAPGTPMSPQQRSSSRGGGRSTPMSRRSSPHANSPKQQQQQQQRQGADTTWCTMFSAAGCPTHGGHVVGHWGRLDPLATPTPFADLPSSPPVREEFTATLDGPLNIGVEGRMVVWVPSLADAATANGEHDGQKKEEPTQGPSSSPGKTPPPLMTAAQREVVSTAAESDAGARELPATPTRGAVDAGDDASAFADNEAEADVARALEVDAPSVGDEDNTATAPMTAGVNDGTAASAEEEEQDGDEDLFMLDEDSPRRRGIAAGLEGLEPGMIISEVDGVAMDVLDPGHCREYLLTQRTYARAGDRDEVMRITAYRTSDRFSKDLYPSSCVHASQVLRGIKAAQEIIGSFFYTTRGASFNVDKKRSLGDLYDTASQILRDGVYIQCVEGTLVGLLLTHWLQPVIRFGLSFESRTPEGTIYKHLVLGLRYGRKYGALGISRNKGLMTKELTFNSLSELVADFIQYYNQEGHVVRQVIVSRPIQRSLGHRPAWRAGRFPLTEVTWPEFERQVKFFESQWLVDPAGGPGIARVPVKRRCFNKTVLPEALV